MYLQFSGLPPSRGFTLAQDAHALHARVDRPVSIQTATMMKNVQQSSIASESGGLARGGVLEVAAPAVLLLVVDVSNALLICRPVLFMCRSRK